MNGTGLIFATNKDLESYGCYIHSNGIFNINRELFIRELLENTWATAAAHHNCLGKSWRNRRTQNTTSQHDSICIRHEWHNVDIRTLKTSRRALKVAVIDGKHHCFACIWSKYS